MTLYITVYSGIDPIRNADAVLQFVKNIAGDNGVLRVVGLCVFGMIPDIDADSGDIILQAFDHFCKILLEQISVFFVFCHRAGTDICLILLKRIVPVGAVEQDLDAVAALFVQCGQAVQYQVVRGQPIGYFLWRMPEANRCLVPPVIEQQRAVHTNRDIFRAGETVDHIISQEGRAKAACGEARYQQGVRLSHIGLDLLYESRIIAVTGMVNRLIPIIDTCA